MSEFLPSHYETFHLSAWMAKTIHILWGERGRTLGLVGTKTGSSLSEDLPRRILQPLLQPGRAGKYPPPRVFLHLFTYNDFNVHFFKQDVGMHSVEVTDRLLHFQTSSSCRQNWQSTAALQHVIITPPCCFCSRPLTLNHFSQHSPVRSLYFPLQLWVPTQKLVRLHRRLFLGVHPRW